MLGSTRALFKPVRCDFPTLEPESRPYISQFASNALARARLGTPLAELVELDEVVLFLDTVRYFFPCKIPFQLRSEICGWIALGLLGKYYPESKDCADWERGELRIHQPKLELLPRADQVVRRYGGRVIGFDIALDLVPRYRRDVSVPRDWILARVTLFQSRVATRVINKNETIYFNRRGRRNNFVLYSDRLGKIVKRPCVHNEVRIRQARALDPLGVSWAADIAKLDLYETFTRRARLHEPDVRALGRIARGRSRAKAADFGYVGGKLCDLDVLEGEELVSEHMSRWARAPLVAKAVRAACAKEEINPDLVLTPIDWPALTLLHR